MRNNGPTTNIEKFLQPGKPIVTRTDLQGRITYANDSFVHMSGFSRAELIGQPHNIVRHPDMPPQAFEDLWRTVKDGNPWRGLVKNRTKQGDFYWVEAYVTPVTENGRTVGFASVRNPPDRREVERAEALYRQVREGSARVPATAAPDRGNAVRLALWLLPALAGIAALAAAGLHGPFAAAAAVAALLALVASVTLLELRVLQPLRRAGMLVRDLDEGKLGTRLPSCKGPLGELHSRLETQRIHLRAIFADVLVLAGTVQDQSQNLHGVINALNDTSRSQSENIASVAASMEELSVSVNEVAANNNASEAAVLRTTEVTAQALAAMGRNLEGSRRSADAVRATQAQIAEVNSSVQQISDVTRIIREIAEQTNLLALNAAIEAARAGEQGRGFAVVADEVRKLAERTSASTQHITSAVADISGRAERAVGAMNQVAGDVDLSARDLQDTSGSLDAVDAASREAGQLAQEIGSMLARQAEASHEVAQNVEMISVAVQNNDHNIGAIGASVAGLHNTAQGLHQLVQHLRSAL